MNGLNFGLTPLLMAALAATAAPAPQKIDQIIPQIEIPVGRTLTPVRRLSCYFTRLANGNARPTIRNVGLNPYRAGSHIVLLADDGLFIQFDLPEELRPGQTFLTNVEHRSNAKVCVAANIQVNLVAAPPGP